MKTLYQTMADIEIKTSAAELIEEIRLQVMCYNPNIHGLFADYLWSHLDSHLEKLNKRKSHRREFEYGDGFFIRKKNE